MDWMDLVAVGGVAVVAALVGCGPQVNPGTSDTDPEVETATAGDDGADAGTDAGDATSDEMIVDGSCASLDPDGPTLAGGPRGESGFPPACNPRSDASGSPYTCCSDDPATFGGALPAFEGKDVPDGGTPLFAGANNALGTWGLCVKTAELPAGSGLAEAAASNCPIPCDPTWYEDTVLAICGIGRQCCQTQVLEDADCVQDPDTGFWRAVDGADIGTTYDNGAIVSTWAPGEHATHQDPNGTGCLQLAGGDQSSDVFRDCVANLHVANHRGFCIELEASQQCPLVGQVDACGRLNAP